MHLVGYFDQQDHFEMAVWCFRNVTKIRLVRLPSDPNFKLVLKAGKFLGELQKARQIT